MAWKFAAVIGGADPRLLDSYQQEREPHVRAVIETAIAMGRVVCMLDETAARERDHEMVARKQRGEQDLSVAYPGLKGWRSGHGPAAGRLLPQPVAQGRRLDDELGLGAALIGRDLPDAASVRRLDLDESVLAPLAPPRARWLGEVDAQAVLVQPDRYVFGTGPPEALLDRWRMAVR
ncbi:FAD-dependent monooxygenase [Phenylobacterium montanum]|uniref:FAD-dependent monooxygenase n=1 Tax=Phenylobacterium montanum TaxID=2823693 RepID=UPI002012122B|nr:FAD-dependent monooxygenase [Caulobacter sp. S6]